MCFDIIGKETKVSYQNVQIDAFNQGKLKNN